MQVHEIQYMITYMKWKKKIFGQSRHNQYYILVLVLVIEVLQAHLNVSEKCCLEN